MPDHIKVELDFIPVEERLPEDEGVVFALSWGGPLLLASYVATEKAWRFCDSPGIRVGEVSYWAKIPPGDMQEAIIELRKNMR